MKVISLLQYLELVPILSALIIKLLLHKITVAEFARELLLAIAELIPHSDTQEELKSYAHGLSPVTTTKTSTISSRG